MPHEISFVDAGTDGSFPFSPAAALGLFIPFVAAYRGPHPQTAFPRRPTDICDKIDSTRIFPAAFSAASKSPPKETVRLA